MRIRCPCNKCLIKMTCKDPCDKFGEFMSLLDKFQEWFFMFFATIDNVIEKRRILSTIFDFVGENVILPIFWYFTIIITGAEMRLSKRTLMDERIDNWEEPR